MPRSQVGECILRYPRAGCDTIKGHKYVHCLAEWRRRPIPNSSGASKVVNSLVLPAALAVMMVALVNLRKPPHYCAIAVAGAEQDASCQPV